MKRALLAGLVIAAVALSAGFGWLSKVRSNELEGRLNQAEKQMSRLREQQQAYARQLAETQVSAAEARRRAEEAAGQALDASTARTRAEEAAAAAEQEKQRAQQARQHAEREALQSRQELDDLRRRREQEMIRMTEALGRIAPTRRTASGIIVELADDSFHFDFDKATLRLENREILSRIAGVLLVSNGYRVSVHGHTDDVGTADYNQQLSERRAEAVSAYLKSAGVSPDVIDSRGFGKASPRVRNSSRESRQKNRRVEIAIVDSIVNYERVLPGGN